MFHAVLFTFPATTQMETESALTKQRRYDLSMSKRTRRTNITMIAAEVNTGDESLLVFAPVASEEKKEAEQALNCISDSSKVAEKETVFVPATPQPALKELIRVTKEEALNCHRAKFTPSQREGFLRKRKRKRERKLVD
jgi:hypothetical protein